MHAAYAPCLSMQAPALCIFIVRFFFFFLPECESSPINFPSRENNFSFDEVSLNSETQYSYIQKRESLGQISAPGIFWNKVFLEERETRKKEIWRKRSYSRDIRLNFPPLLTNHWLRISYANRLARVSYTGYSMFQNLNGLARIHSVIISRFRPINDERDQSARNFFYKLTKTRIISLLARKYYILICDIVRTNSRFVVR